ncbi:MAG: hypothetical protein HY426_04720, partial [Candidatus Levybacteria bacterium]|nr:hypothetical protein [Candidatus Levybacteria bacterium]
HRITQDTIYGESLTPEEILQTRTTFDPSKHMPDTMPRVVFIEEIERNNDPQANELSFRNISELRAGLFAPRIIVTGEDTLRDPRFFELIGADPKDVLQVDMPRLTGEILNEALRKRLVYLFGDQARGLNINIFAPEVLNALIPNTDPPIATMRDTFSYIKQLSEYFKFGDKEKAEKPVEYDQPTFIDGQLFGRAIRSIHQGEVSPEQNALFQYIRAQYDPNFPFKPLMVEKLIELFGIDVDLSVEDPRKRALRERSLLQNLESIGLMEVRDSKLSPKPILEREFLPTVESFVRAAFVTTSMGEEL